MISNREELRNALHEAAELEHGLLLQYLFAAFSLKRRLEEGLSPLDQALIGNWERVILAVAVEEMAHLGTVCNLLSAIGAAPHFRRPNFPQPMQAYYPFDFQLERFNDSTLYRFLCFELPVGEPPPPQRMGIAPMDVAPEPIVYSRVGELYGQIREAFETLPDLFIGPEINQDTDDWAPDLKVRLVRDRQSASEAINNIVIEGEGTPEKREGSHYARFQQVRQALAERPDFEAARPVVKNPLTRMHRDVNSDSSVTLISHPDSKAVAEVFSQVYQTALMMLAQFYSYGGETGEQRASLQAAARQLMSAALRPLGEQLTQMPATDDPEVGNAGPTFEFFWDISIPPVTANRWRILDERLTAASDECALIGGQATGPQDPRYRLSAIGESIRLLARNLQNAART